METPDAQLMHRFQAGDNTAFEELVHRYRTRLVRFLQRLVADPAVAEELAQDTFLRVYLARGRYQSSAAYSTWIYRIATNLALNWIRDTRGARRTDSLDAPTTLGIRLQIPAAAPTAEQRLVHNVNLSRIREAIAALPERQRAAVILHKYEGQDYEAIARTLQCSVPALKSLLCRAYAVLRSRLLTEEGAEPALSYREARRRFPKNGAPGEAAPRERKTRAQNSLPLYIAATYCS